jgi:gentisate 1,2-dioxygenase
MATNLRPTLADPELPPDVLAEMEKLNEDAAPLNIWLRTHANAAMHPPWHRPDLPPSPRPGRAQPVLWKWAEFEPYLHRIAAIAPLEFTERQQFLLMNPGFGGALTVTNSIRVAVSIYKPGDDAETHRHTPNASRTILSDGGGYTTVEGERCSANRGDLILTPNGTWHGHGNDSNDPVIWIDVLDWPLLEYLDAIWIDRDFPMNPGGAGGNAAPLKDGLSGKLYGAGGIIPRSPNVPRGAGIGGSPMFHYSGTDIRNTLNGLRDIDSTPWDAVTVDFTNPQTGDAVFATLGYTATLLKPGEETAESRSTAGTFFTAIAGTGYTEVAGQKLEWGKNDLFVIPNHTWYRHVNTGGTDDAILYGISDRPLLEKIGHYRRQGRDESGTVLDI